MWVGIINMLYISLQLFGLDPIYVIKGTPGNIDAVGMLGLKAVVGMWSALAMIVTVSINPLLSLGFLITMYTSQSTGAILGLSLGVGTYLYYTNRKVFRVVVPIIIVVGGLYVAFIDSPMGMFGTRPPMWKQAVKDTVYGVKLNDPKVQSPYLCNFLTGYGGGSFKAGNIKYFKVAVTDETIRGILLNGRMTSPDGTNFVQKNGQIYYKGQRCDYWDNPHNDYIRLIFEFGFIGMIIFGCFLYFMWKRFYHSRKSKELIVITSLLIAFGGFATTQFPTSLARIGYLVPILIGLFVVHTQEDK